jgi:GNAT superfamily N-acetyltransferase
VRVRPAAPADVPAVVQLILALAEYERLAGEAAPDEARLREHLFGAERRAEVLVAEVHGRIGGFALFFPTYSTFLTRPGLWLEDLFVLPELRRCGIGTALLRRVAEIAVERGCGRLEWSVLDWNEPALRFYRRLGARPLDEWTVQRMEGGALAALAAGDAAAGREPTRGGAG